MTTWTTFARIVMILAVILVVFQFYPPAVRILGEEWAFPILSLIAAAIIAAIFVPSNVQIVGFTPGGFVGKLIAGFLFVTAIFAVFFALNPRSPLFTTPEGHWHIALYYFLAFAFAVVAANYEGARLGFAVLTFILLFTLLGMLSTARLYDPDGRVFGPLLARWSETTVQASGMPTSCVGVVQTPIRLRETPIRVPEGCQMTFDFDGGTLKLYGQPGMRPVTIEEGGTLTWPKGFQIRAVSAANQNEVVNLWATFVPKTTAYWTAR